ncbi:hypothetical protein [Blastomonas sp.]|uniref:hypothetical protein n=1 Tax=Blastomonas sp. TaxID=1909299 RepID=UPI0017FAA9B7|nr:hypothetical protein [Blastomonas sp.]
MPLYTVLTRLLGREPNGEDLPGSVIELDEDDALELVALGALEPAPEDAVATDGSDPIEAALGALNVKQLKALAAAAQLDLGTATKKPDIQQLLADSVDRDDADKVAAFIVMAETAKAS